MADAHLAELLTVGGALDAVVIFAAREAVPHGLHIGRNCRRGPVGVAIVGGYAAQMLKLLVFVFHRALQPVLAIEIYHDTTLVEAVMTLREVSLHHEAEKLLARLHLKHGGIVVLEVIVGALPEVGLRSGGDANGIILDFTCGRLPRPLEAVQIDVAAVRECHLYVVYEIHSRYLFVLLSACREHETSAEK